MFGLTYGMFIQRTIWLQTTGRLYLFPFTFDMSLYGAWNIHQQKIGIIHVYMCDSPIYTVNSWICLAFNFTCIS